MKAEKDIIMCAVQTKRKEQPVVRDTSFIVVKMGMSAATMITNLVMQIITVEIMDTMHTVMFNTVNVRIVWLRGSVTVPGENVWSVHREKHV